MRVPAVEDCVADDVVDDLQRLARIEPSELVCAVYRRAIAEITGLRAVAGAVTPGPSLADLKKPAPGMD